MPSPKRLSLTVTFKRIFLKSQSILFTIFDFVVTFTFGDKDELIRF